MKGLKKNSRISILMVVSQVMLAVFVFQWLVSQSRIEKDQLQKELSHLYTEVERQVIDSALVHEIINPILTDTTKPRSVTIRFQAENVSNISDELQKFVRMVAEEPKCTKDTIHSTKKRVSGIDTTFQSNVLLNGVRLIVKKGTPSLKSLKEITTKSPYNPDTTLLKQLFSERLQSNNWLFSSNWKNNIDPEANKSKYILITSGFQDNYGVEIKGYNSYLLQQLYPEILFAILLLILTAAAFYFSFRSLKKQEALNLMRNEIVSNLSHELKTPVSTVQVALEALQNFDMKNNPKVTDEYLRMASLEMDRLELLINKVVSSSVLEDGNQLIFPEKTDLKTLVDEVVHILRLRFNKEEAKVKVEAGKEKFECQIDRLYIQGVLINLIDNSLKYSGNGAEIVIRLEKNTDTLKLSVSDNGPGIPEEYMDRIFDKFFRVPTNNRHNVKGYGLGLSFASMVMKHHGGTIDVKNLKPAGCMFTLNFVNEK